MIKFYKVSFEQYKKDILNIASKTNSCFVPDEEAIRKIWENIKLPKRSTKGSAGYDFFAPHPIRVNSDHPVQVPSGIRCEMDENVVLLLYPRSGFGFKAGMHMTNTVGVIDSDYFRAENEGHIQGKFLLEHKMYNEINIAEGQAYMQGVFVKYEVTEDDDTDGIRTGGFGSTDKKN